MYKAPYRYTRHLGFIKASPSAIAEVYVRWINGLNRGQRIASRTLNDLPFLRKIELLEPPACPFTKCFISQTDSDWSAVIHNDRLEYGCKEHVEMLAYFGGFWGLFVAFDEDTMRALGNKMGRYGACVFKLFEPVGIQKLDKRIISLINDGPWDFYTEGNVRAFENTESYSRRKVRERFTPDLFDSYCKHFGIRMFDPAFFDRDRGEPAQLLTGFHPA